MSKIIVFVCMLFFINPVFSQFKHNFEIDGCLFEFAFKDTQFNKQNIVIVEMEIYNFDSTSRYFDFDSGNKQFPKVRLIDAFYRNREVTLLIGSCMEYFYLSNCDSIILLKEIKPKAKIKSRYEFNSKYPMSHYWSEFQLNFDFKFISKDLSDSFISTDSLRIDQIMFNRFLNHTRISLNRQKRDNN